VSFVSVVVSMEIGRRYYFWSNLLIFLGEEELSLVCGAVNIVHHLSPFFIIFSSICTNRNQDFPQHCSTAACTQLPRDAAHTLPAL